MLDLWWSHLCIMSLSFWAVYVLIHELHSWGLPQSLCQCQAGDHQGWKSSNVLLGFLKSNCHILQNVSYTMARLQFKRSQLNNTMQTVCFQPSTMTGPQPRSGEPFATPTSQKGSWFSKMKKKNTWEFVQICNETPGTLVFLIPRLSHHPLIPMEHPPCSEPCAQVEHVRSRLELGQTWLRPASTSKFDCLEKTLDPLHHQTVVQL